MESTTLQQDPVTPPHPRVLGWVGTAALAMGGSCEIISKPNEGARILIELPVKGQQHNV